MIKNDVDMTSLSQVRVDLKITDKHGFNRDYATKLLTDFYIPIRCVGSVCRVETSLFLKYFDRMLLAVSKEKTHRNRGVVEKSAVINNASVVLTQEKTMSTIINILSELVNVEKKAADLLERTMETISSMESRLSILEKFGERFDRIDAFLSTVEVHDFREPIVEQPSKEIEKKAEIKFKPAVVKKVCIIGVIPGIRTSIKKEFEDVLDISFVEIGKYKSLTKQQCSNFNKILVLRGSVDHDAIVALRRNGANPNVITSSISALRDSLTEIYVE